MHYYVKAIKQNTRNGKTRRRIFVEKQAADAFMPGDRYDVFIEEGKIVSLVGSPAGSRVISGRIDPKTGMRSIPVIDLESDDILKPFEGHEFLKLVVLQPGRMMMVPLASEMHKQERLARLREKLEKGLPLDLGSLTHGGGIFCHAIHKGLEDVGFDVRLQWANDLSERWLEHAREHNDVWSDETMMIAASMTEWIQDEWFVNRLRKLDGLDISLPCSGASVSGVAKLGLEKMEDHPEVGHLSFAALFIIMKVQPSFLMFENVPNYARSASAAIIRKQLKDMGYDVYEAIVRGRDFNAIEDRERWCMVAVTKGLYFDFSMLRPEISVVRRVEDILDVIPDDDPCWKSMEGAKRRQAAQAKAGKNFRMQIVKQADAYYGSIGKGYMRNRNTEPKLAHPTDPDKLRLLTPAEHARGKGVPERLIAGLPPTSAHEILGQGIVYEPFFLLGRLIGQMLHRFADGLKDQKLSGAMRTRAEPVRPRRPRKIVG